MNRLSSLQKELVIWITFCVFVVFCCSFYIEARTTDYSRIIRFHVLANSDSKEDQILKLKVRDKVVKTLEGEIMEAAKNQDVLPSKTFTRNYLMRNLDRINKMAEDTVKKNGFNYITKANLGVCFIPEKSYEGVVFPAGNYQALNITIGNGNGHNWFCVIYPPLCLIKKSGKRHIKLRWKIQGIIKKNKKIKRKTARR